MVAHPVQCLEKYGIFGILGKASPTEFWPVIQLLKAQGGNGNIEIAREQLFLSAFHMTFSFVYLTAAWSVNVSSR